MTDSEARPWAHLALVAFRNRDTYSGPHEFPLHRLEHAFFGTAKVEPRRPYRLIRRKGRCCSELDGNFDWIGHND